MLTPIALPDQPARNGLDLINRATTIAMAAHHGQTRKDGRTPQFTHPLAVQRLAAQAGVEDPVVHATALLHDALEDNPGAPAAELEQMIRLHLGGHVLGLVQVLTDDLALPCPQRKADQIARFKTAPWNARVVKLADVIASMQEGPAPHWTAGKAAAYVEQRIALVDGALRGTCALLEHEFLKILASPAWARPRS